MPNNFILHCLALTLFTLLCHPAHASSTTTELSALVENFDYTIPTPKLVKTGNETCKIAKTGELLTPVSFNKEFSSVTTSLEQTRHFFGHSTGSTVTVKLANGIATPATEMVKKDIAHINGAYIINISCKEIIIYANTNEGHINGLTTLESLIATHKGNLTTGQIVDYPLTKIRALHLSLWPTDMLDFKTAIKRARFGHYNTLILMINAGVNLNFSRHFAAKNAWDKTDFINAVQFVKGNGLELIPEIKLLSHQKRFLAQSRPDLMYNKQTYDPRKQELYTNIVFPAIDELIETTGSTKLHIGHDEIVGYNSRHYLKGLLNVGDTQLPPALFLKDTLILYNYLKQKHVDVWMWGDMLISKEEFPEMKGAGGANLNGYNGYSSLRKKIPTDIVIADWHYIGQQTQFPTALAFSENGHKVLGATWKNLSTTRNFTRYINRLPNNGEGMIATTWYGLTDKKQGVFSIITLSAEAFWNEQ